MIGNAVGSGRRLAVALSGGVDSVVLLDILARLAARQRIELSAIHVNHQISPNAARWAAFCRALCCTRGIPLRVAKIAVRRGNSLEAAARAARYEVFRGVPADFIVLAHNQDDQAETVLLQLLRGAGVKGLAAMPVVRREMKAAGARASPAILRPLLDVPRSEIERYARARRLEWVEDESNSDVHFLRNFLRHEILPRAAQRVPSYRAVLARSARHFAEAATLLDELAAADAARYRRGAALEVAGLRHLSSARAGNLLRWHLAACGVRMPGAERIGEALRQALEAKHDARLCIDLGASELRRFAGALYVVPKQEAPPARFERSWRGERRLVLKELGGMLTMTGCRGTGIDLARLGGKPVTVRVRRGGEWLRPDGARPRRSLKNLLQEAGIPPWERARLPLLCCGDALVWVPGIGVDSEFQARRGAPAVSPSWEPSGHSATTASADAANSFQPGK